MNPPKKPKRIEVCLYHGCYNLPRNTRSKTVYKLCDEHHALGKLYDKRLHKPSKEERRCLYHGCTTVLFNMNLSHFCYSHNRRLAFELAGGKWDDTVLLPPRQSKTHWQKVTEKLLGIA